MGGVGVGGPAQQPVERLLPREQRHGSGIGQRVLVGAGVSGELEGEHGQGAPDRIQVGGGGGPVGRDLRRLVADRPVDGAVLVVDPAHAAHVDELEHLLRLDHVVRLEVAVDQPAAVQVAERAQHLDRVGERVLDRHRPASLPLVQQDLPERAAADVLHHDVSGRLAAALIGVLDEVVDPDDVGVVHGGQELPLRHRGRHGVRVAGAEQALQHPPAVADVAVLGQVDPAEPAVRQAAEHLVLAADQIPGLQLRGEGEAGAAVAAETLGQPGPPVPGAADGLLAVRAESPALRHLWVGEYGAGGVLRGDRRDLHQARAEVPPGRSAGAGVRAAGAGAAARCPDAAAGARRGRGRAPLVVGRRDRHRGRGGGHPADRAVPVFDGAAAARLGAGGRCRRCRRWPGRGAGDRGRGGGHPADRAVPVFDGAAAARLRALGSGCGHCGCLRPLSARVAC